MPAPPEVTTHDAGQSYVLDIIDVTTRCIVNDSGVHNLDWFCQLLELDPADIELGACYEFDEADIAAVMHALGRNCDEGRLSGLLRPWCLTDQLPYKVHTNRELIMMLAGMKPIAVFSDSHPSTLPPFEVIPEDVFAPHVESGRFVSREVIVQPEHPARDPTMRIVCYALPTEQWRIDAYLLLRRAGFKYGWSETCERMEGTLLGYTDEQNDTYIEMIYRKHLRASPGDL